LTHTGFCAILRVVMKTRSLLTPRWTPLRPHPEQDRLWRSSARFALVAAGRSSGKTELAKRKMVMALAEPVPGCSRPMYFIAGPTHPQVKRQYWDDMKALVPPNWMAGEANETALQIRTVFGSELFLCGLDTPQRIEGTQWCGGIVDECSDVKPGAWSLSIRPALSSFSGWAWRIGVPKRWGVGAAEFRTAFESAEGNAFWWKSSDILTAEETAAAKADLSEDDFSEQYEAQWLNAAGAMFSAYCQDNIVATQYQPGSVIYVGCDFNVDPMCWMLAHKVGSKLHVFDELFVRNTNTQDSLTRLWNKYQKHEGGWVFTGDASSKSRKTSAQQTDYVIICNDKRFAGKRVHFGDSNPGVADRMAATNRQLKDAAGNIGLAIDPKCVHLLEDLRLRNTLGSVGDIGHMSDALGYLVWGLFPLRINLPAPKIRQAGAYVQ